ncbi:MAG TPA: sensor domain-containing diguanylate cyclase [Xanthobacteraceae bacterium]|nr:sensor domain-containing diguanylate cyclase [Xanthobacteraceae bacterium]
MRLHWHFVLIVLIAVMPIFALYVSRLQSKREYALSQARAHAADLANNAASVQAGIALRARNVLEMVAQSPVLRGSVDQCDEFLNWVQYLLLSQDDKPWMTGIFVVDRTGKGLCGTFTNSKSLAIGDRPHFQQALETKNFVTSEIIIGRISRRPIIAAELPILNARGEIELVVGLGADLERLDEIALEASRKFHGLLLVLDDHGRVIANLPKLPDGEISRSFDEPAIISALVNANAPIVEAADRAGMKRIFGVKQLPNGQFVAVGLDRETVLMPVEHAFRSDLLFLLLVAAASIAAALIMAEFGVLRGVRLLKGAALRLKAGGMGLRVKLPVFVAAELHDLSTTYNAMTAEFERLAYLDRLTGLPNRRYFERELAGRNGNDKHSRQAVLAIDLDGFKPVNDSYGHAVGDRVLAAVARRIATVIAGQGLLARVGGDEFVAVLPLPDGKCREVARTLAEQIRADLEIPVETDQLSFVVGCSVGIAVVPDDASSLAGALVVADSALYEAKRGGRNRVIDNAPPIAADVEPDAGKQSPRTALEFNEPV